MYTPKFRYIEYNAFLFEHTFWKMTKKEQIKND